MQIKPTPLGGMLVIEPRVFEDEREYFLETHHYQRFQSANIDCTFVQDNLSFS
jgi:dTDP-4-dehydrorhamnose 3,5-epimerase